MKSMNLEKCSLIQCVSFMEQLCEPIFKKTPINFVSFARIYKDGGRSNLGVDINWQKYLLENGFHLAGTEDALIDDKRPLQSHELWSASSMFSLNEKTKEFFKACIAHNYGNGITLIERGNDYTEFVHFCAAKGCEPPDEYLYNNIDYLWWLVLYLREGIQNNEVLRKSYVKRYYHRVTQTKKEMNVQSQNLALSIKKYYLSGDFGDIGFSKREIDCMIMVCQHKTMHEQSHILNLSPRTIEKHIEKIKMKTGCVTTRELARQLLSNNAFVSLMKCRVWS